MRTPRAVDSGVTFVATAALAVAFAVAFAVALAVAAAGCTPVLPPYTVHVPPRLVDVRPVPSVVFARADVPLDGVRRALEDALPPRLDGQAQRGPVHVRWALARQPATVEGAPRGVHAQIAELGEIELAVGPIHCRAPSGGFVIGAVGRPRLTETGALALADLAVTTRPIGELACAGMRVPAEALFGALAAPLERAVARGLEAVTLPLGPLIDRGLDELATPRALSLDGTPACLELAPSALVLAPATGQGGTVTFKVGFEVAPRVIVGACPPPAPRARAATRVRETTLDQAFAVDVALALPTAELERRVRDALVGHVYGSGRRAIVVRGIELGDASGRVLARVDVAGALNGALYLWGTPSVVARGGRWFVELPDLQAAAETRSLIERVALWLWRLHDGGLETALRREVSLDVTDRLTAARAALTRDWPPLHGLTLATTIDRIDPGTVESRPGIIVAHARLVGHADLR
jgi:Domain of unknown function (DUF4403)